MRGEAGGGGCSTVKYILSTSPGSNLNTTHRKRKRAVGEQKGGKEKQLLKISISCALLNADNLLECKS